MGPFWAHGPRLGPWAGARAHKMSILSNFAFLQKRRASSVRVFCPERRAEISHMSPKTADFVFFVFSLIGALKGFLNTFSAFVSEVFYPICGVKTVGDSLIRSGSPFWPSMGPSSWFSGRFWYFPLFCQKCRTRLFEKMDLRWSPLAVPYHRKCSHMDPLIFISSLKCDEFIKFLSSIFP